MNIFSKVWYFAALLNELQENNIMEQVVAERTICLLKKEGQILAFSARCPHAGAYLCEGWLDALGRVVCPLHQYRFNPVNGYNTSGEGYKLKTYPVKVEEGRIFVQF